jgi:hypothetical protein
MAKRDEISDKDRCRLGKLNIVKTVYVFVSSRPVIVRIGDKVTNVVWCL